MADIDDLERAYGELAQAGRLDASDLQEIGHLAIDIVLTRTKHGKDADGKLFKAYSPGYVEQRRRMNVQTTPVDLAVKGHMLGAMTPLVTGDNEVTVGFMSQLEATKAATISAGVHKTVNVRGKNGPFERRMNMDARDFLDVRRSNEMNMLADEISAKLAAKVSR